jgi:hypothetical protein
VDEHAPFARASTRSSDELTGNSTLGRGLEHFTAGMSAVFQQFARALKRGRPFVFTYHHNDPAAYLPLVVAILDAGLECTATLPAAAEMTASLHIAGTGSSILDSVFVCRNPATKAARRAEVPLDAGAECAAALDADSAVMREAGVNITAGDRRCLLAGHVARIAARTLSPVWDVGAPLAERLAAARRCLEQIAALAGDPGTAAAQPPPPPPPQRTSAGRAPGAPLRAPPPEPWAGARRGPRRESSRDRIRRAYWRPWGAPLRGPPPARR